MNQALSAVASAPLAAAGELLQSLGHEIANFQPGFKGTAKKTYIISPYATEMFGLDILDREPVLGVPEKFYRNFMNIPWEYAAWIRGAAGIFFITSIGTKTAHERVGFRLSVRKRRSLAIGRFRELRLVELNKAGEITQSAMNSSFTVPLKEISRLEWE